MAKTATLKEEFNFPSGGIADFYMEDHEIEALEREEAEQEFGSEGIATFNPVAQRMASYGRYGDDTVAHVETGELIVPKALIENNPKLRDSIFSHLKELGVEDPERYVVGSGANSINPDTGMPEFFLKKIFKGVKKAVSGVAKGVKKAFKGVVNVVKKAAPVIIPFALNAMFPGLGAIYSGALGSGIGTLIQGGSIKDAFKNALIGGAIGGATAGVQGALAARSAGTSMSQGALQGIQDAAKFSNLSTAGKQLATGQFGQSGYESVIGGTELPSATPVSDAGGADQFQGQVADAGTTVTDAGTSPLQTAPADDFVRNESFTDALTGGADSAAGTSPTNFAEQAMSGVDQSSLASGDVAASKLGETVSDSINLGAETTGGGSNFLQTAQEYGGKTMDFLTGGAPSDDAIYKLAGEKIAAAKQAGLELASSDAITAATKELTPGLLRTYGPSVALAGAGAYASGFFDKPEDPDLDIDDIQGTTGADLLEQDPGKYLVEGGDTRIRGADGQFVVPTNYAFLGNRPLFGGYLPRNPFIQQAAKGGEIFPRRIGGIMPDEGIPGKDSVRAMLMPGEFVMTTDAVRGLGNGNNNVGINRMYDLMRGLDAKGKAMA
mgnify:CR=1 FL=1